jgi:ABC-type dipeptide/oligopeptide/nickel transport system permease subunit
MNHNRILGFVLLVTGLIILCFGLQATESFGETIKEGLTGRYTDRTMWYIVGGSFVTIVGAGMAFFGPRPKTA